MARSYTHIKQYYEEMEQMHQEGHSCREIGEKFGFTKEQVKECLRRPRRKAQDVYKRQALTTATGEKKSLTINTIRKISSLTVSQCPYNSLACKENVPKVAKIFRKGRGIKWRFVEASIGIN